LKVPAEEHTPSIHISALYTRARMQLALRAVPRTSTIANERINIEQTHLLSTFDLFCGGGDGR
jgi:hypothetical protein